MDEKQICGVLADAYDSSLERQYCVLDYIREATSFNSWQWRWQLIPRDIITSG